MKIYMSIDMEGLAGTNTWRQEDTASERVQIRESFKDQINWIIQGINQSELNSQITEIIIADSHASGDNLFYSITELDERINLISGTPRPQYMMPDFTDDIYTVFLVGYHAGKGKQNGAMDHTYSGKCIHNLWINDELMNEALINSAYAGYHKVPVSLVIGDEALKEELIEDNKMPWVEFVSTKKALSRFSSKHYSKAIVQKNTIDSVKKVLSEKYSLRELYTITSPHTLKIEFSFSAMADYAQLMPCVNRINGNTIEITHEDYKIILDSIMAAVHLASLGK